MPRVSFTIRKCQHNPKHVDILYYLTWLSQPGFPRDLKIPTKNTELHKHIPMSNLFLLHGNLHTDDIKS